MIQNVYLLNKMDFSKESQNGKQMMAFNGKIVWAVNIEIYIHQFII